MKVLVAGGAGFIGSHYVRAALSGAYPTLAEADITVVDKLTYAGNMANLASVSDNLRFRFVAGDICDSALLTRVVPGHDIIINFAAETHVDRSIDGAGDFVLTNVLGTARLLQASVDFDIDTYVHVSTDEVYGSTEFDSWPETDPLLPNSPYSATKAGADLLCRAFHRTYGIDVRITRCSNNYGPYQFPEKVIPLFVTNLFDGLSVPLYGDGLHRRDWLHVDDHCRGVQLVLEKGIPGEIYNIGGGTELSNKELTGLLLDACGADWSMVKHVTDRRGHDRRYSVDISKIRSIGYEPRVSFAEGLADTVAWYQGNESWWRPLKAA